MVRPKLITFLCVILFLIGTVQFVGSLGGIIVGNGIGPEKIFDRTSKYEVPDEDLIDTQSEIPAVIEPGQQEQTTTEVPEHIIPAAKYGLLVSFMLLVSVVKLWQMQKSGVYIFTAVSAGNIVTQSIWKPEWLIQSQSGIWFSILLAAITLLIVLPHWKKLSLPESQREKKPPSDVLGLDIFNFSSINRTPDPAPPQEAEKK